MQELLCYELFIFRFSLLGLQHRLIVNAFQERDQVSYSADTHDQRDMHGQLALSLVDHDSNSRYT
jgi:hypothetical protein